MGPMITHIRGYGSLPVSMLRYQTYGTMENVWYGTIVYPKWKFLRRRRNSDADRIQGHTLFEMDKSRGPQLILAPVASHFPVPHSGEYWPIPKKELIWIDKTELEKSGSLKKISLYLYTCSWWKPRPWFNLTKYSHLTNKRGGVPDKRGVFKFPNS